MRISDWSSDVCSSDLAELVGHDQARDHAHAEIDGKNLDPVKIELAVDRVAGFQPAALQHSQVTGQAYGDRRKNNMEGDRETELNPGQHQCIEIHAILLVPATKMQETMFCSYIHD